MRIRPTFPVDSSHPPAIALVGEAPGATEADEGAPFVGASGKELTHMLREAGINRSDCYLTNVFFDRPEGNKIEAFCGKKKEVSDEYLAMVPSLRQAHPFIDWPATYTWAAHSQGKYFRPAHLPELYRLRDELQSVGPTVVVALGNTACWAMLGSAGITKLRGATARSTLVPGVKVVPTFHPAAILRQWDNRPIAVIDLMKAKRESLFPELRRPQRFVWTAPSVKDCWDFAERFLWRPLAGLIAVDIETSPSHRQITCIGFSGDRKNALVIPLVDKTSPDFSFYSRSDEILIHQFIRTVLGCPVPKLAQNGLYDFHFIWRTMGIPVRNFDHDSMLLHHAVQPEMLKGLGFLGSVYTDEASWKIMRPRASETEKADE